MNNNTQNITLDKQDEAILITIATCAIKPIDWKEVILNYFFFKKTVIWYQLLNDTVRRLVTADFLKLENGVVHTNEKLITELKAITIGTHADYTRNEQLFNENPINQELLANLPEKIVSVQEFEEAMERFYKFIKSYMPQKLAPRMIAEDMLLLESISTDPTYGLSLENPIRVGGFKMCGTWYIHLYFNSLLGHNGEPIKYKRLGSHLGLDTPDEESKHGFTDSYAVFVEGITKPIKVYINMYDCKLPLKAPMGFGIKEESK